MGCSVTVLCGELLREAEFLVNQRVHPMTIVQGWRQAVQIARGALEKVSAGLAVHCCGVLGCRLLV